MPEGETLALMVALLRRDPYNLDARVSLGESLYLNAMRTDAAGTAASTTSETSCVAAGNVDNEAATTQ